MTNSEIQKLLENQRAFYQTGSTIPVSFRVAQLKKLHAAVAAHEAAIARALQEDLGKSPFEGFMCETGLVLSELSFLIRNTKRLARGKTVPTPLAQFPSRSFTQPVPYGSTRIMSPRNYPFLLTLEPLADAIAAR